VDQTTGHAHFLENFPGADVTPEELEFLKAMERFQSRHHRRYPTWREVLFVLKSLGYRRVATPGPQEQTHVRVAPPE
jgi:hypothetical protein